ncbi:MAG: SPOR domain-containing protein [Candidatus Methylomirabilia bacterium]
MRKVAGPVLSEGKFWVQLGAFKSSRNATQLAAQIRAEHYPVEVRWGKSPGAPYVVWVGKYSKWERAKQVRAALQRKGFRGFILRDERG